MKSTRWIAGLAAASLLFLSAPIKADTLENGGGPYTVYSEDGSVLFTYSGQVYAEDQYISGDNKLYQVSEVDDAARQGKAAYVEDVELPDIFEEVDSTAFAPEDTKRIAIYFTHTDESYIPGDGAESVEGQGGIVDVGEEFAAALEEKGVEVEVDTTNHLPHDAGAYRRSKSTVKNLLESNPDAIFDIHRDGVSADEYVEEIDGKAVSKIRMVVGKKNQNQQANLEFAKSIKAVADKEYPGLVKDIYIGKGSYNQEIGPRCILFELGTHEIEKERVLESSNLLADVVYTTLYGGTVEDKSEASGGSEEAPQQTPEASAGGAGGAGSAGATPQAQQAKTYNVKPAREESKGMGSGLIWLLVVVVGGGAIFLFVSTGKNERKAKLVDNVREMFPFKKRDDDDPS